MGFSAQTMDTSATGMLRHYKRDRQQERWYSSGFGAKEHPSQAREQAEGAEARGACAVEEEEE
jgi:hypothetical protein